MDRLTRMARRRRNRAFRVRKRVRGTSERPRLSVHRTGKHIYCQIIDDDAGRTLCATSSLALKLASGANLDAAKKVGTDIGAKAKELNIERIGFDRGTSRYQGRVKVLADAAREAGLKF